jgi:hypothetical protein
MYTLHAFCLFQFWSDPFSIWGICMIRSCVSCLACFVYISPIFSCFPYQIGLFATENICKSSTIIKSKYLSTSNSTYHHSGNLGQPKYVNPRAHGPFRTPDPSSVNDTHHTIDPLSATPAQWTKPATRRTPIGQMQPAFELRRGLALLRAEDWSICKLIAKVNYCCMTVHVTMKSSTANLKI